VNFGGRGRFGEVGGGWRKGTRRGFGLALVKAGRGEGSGGAGVGGVKEGKKEAKEEGEKEERKRGGKHKRPII
jgi:hypothetical protein